MIPRFRPDLLPSPLLLNQMRHTFLKKIVFCRFLSVLLRMISIFYVHSLFHPLECWKTQKTASNLVSYFLCTEAKLKITQMPSPKNRLYFHKYLTHLWLFTLIFLINCSAVYG